MEAVRNEYAKIGVDNYYIKHQDDYRNPHEKIVGKLLKIAQEKQYLGMKVLDLCCGSGEVSVALFDKHQVVGCDPYTSKAYQLRTNKIPLTFSFKDIAQGKLVEQFDTVVCSFALHLCEESMLPALLWHLGQISNKLIVITPNKRPDCHNISSWHLKEEIVLDRVRMRVYFRNE